MGKQGTITSFFRSSGTGKGRPASKSSNKASVLGSKKRPRPSSSVSRTSQNTAGHPGSDTQNSAKRSKGDGVLDDTGISNIKTKEDTVASVEEVDAGKLGESDNTANTTGVKGVNRLKALAHEAEKKLNRDSDKDDNGEEDGGEGEEDHISVESDEDDEDEVPKRKRSAKKTVSASQEISRLATARTWKDGQPVPYQFLADTFCKVEELSGRLEIQAVLSELFRNIISSTPEDLVPAIYLSINKLAPAHEGIELGIGESILLKALAQVSGRTVPALKTLYKEIGDLGDVAAASRTSQKTMFPPPPLTIRKVYQEFRAIAAISGKSTQEAKRSKISKVLVAASRTEAKYVVRALFGKLRIHLADKTAISALAAAVTLEKLKVKTDVLLTEDGKKKSKMTSREESIEEAVIEATAILSRVYSQLPVWDVIVPKLLELKTIDERLSNECKLIPGVPVSPMLAKPTKAISEVLEKFEESVFTCEYKYDGERAQVHRLEDGSIRIYSRSAENLTPKYPDLVSRLPATLGTEKQKASFIIDAEAVAYDIEKKKILPFQELQSRKRKDVNEESIKVKVCIFAFDILYFNGESLIGESLTERRQALNSNFVEQEGEFMFAKGHDSRDPDEIMDLLNASIKEGCEGLMVKALKGPNSTYEPANRSQNWLKVKKDYLEGCGDSLDLVPIGGYLGRGKRTGQYGAFLLACYDPDNEEYQSICKIGTGFTEEVLETFALFYNDAEAERTIDAAKSYYRVPTVKTLQPDVWFEPVQVWEVKCADLSLSPQHTAGMGLVAADRGIALRFPRFLRVRDDKKPEEATCAEQVAEFYMRQSSVTNNT